VPAEQSQNVEQVLARDHDALDELLRALVAALDDGKSATAFERLDLFWARLAMHIRAENLHLFPSILESSKGVNDKGSSLAEASKAIDQLRNDHDFFMQQLSDAIKILRGHQTVAGKEGLTRLKDVRDIIFSLRDRLGAHNELEERLVYRMPARLLASEERLTLSSRIRAELENLPPRFAQARDKQLPERDGSS
jgi:iron-sulfur cluster repair protein YtfE (RIC family)